MAEFIFLHFPVSWLPQPQQFLCTNTLVPQKFCHVMPTNFNDNPIAAIPHSALKIWALCFIPDRQSIKVWQTIQAQSLAWPAFTADMLYYSRSSFWAYIQAGMEVMMHLSGSPPSQQIPEYTTQAKVGVLCTPR